MRQQWWESSAGGSRAWAEWCSFAPGLPIWSQPECSIRGEMDLTPFLVCLSQGLAFLVPTTASGLFLLVRDLQLHWGMAHGL